MSQSFLALCTAAVLIVLEVPVVAHAQRPAQKPRRVENVEEARPRPQPAPAAQRELPASARYRVTLTGFRVNHESYDTFLETDGKGDEVRISADVQPLGGDGNPVGEPRRLATATYGDRNSFGSRIAAGTRSAQGGLRTGDNVPATASPWLRTDPPQKDRLPLLLWEGELRRGENAVAISPIVWELDSDDLIAAAPANIAAAAGQQAATVIRLLSGVPPVLAEVATFAASFGRGQAQSMNRPIGLRAPGDGYRFTAKALVLSVATAEGSLASNAGKAPGVIEVRYSDATELSGDYTLYLQVERLP